MTPVFLVGTCSNSQLIKADEESRDFVDEAKNYLLLPQERGRMQGPRTRPRRPVNPYEFLFAVGGWCSGDAIQTVERYDPVREEWSMVASMNKRRCGVGVAVLDNIIYAIGGHDGTSYLQTVEKFDPNDENAWSTAVAPTSTCRTSVGVAVLNGWVLMYLYAIGGQDGGSCLDLVERYDQANNKWERKASMKTRRLGVGVAVLNEFVYAVGGSDGGKPWDSVEKYNPKNDTWQKVCSMSTARKHLGCAVYNDYIYAVGGRDDCTELNSVERYCDKDDRWTPVVAMQMKRSGVGLAVVGGQLLETEEKRVQAAKLGKKGLQIQNIIKSMEDSPFFAQMKGQLDGLVERGIFNIHCYGLGSPANSRSSRHQTALLGPMLLYLPHVPLWLIDWLLYLRRDETSPTVLIVNNFENIIETQSNEERSELKILNRYLSNMTVLTCLPVENNWEDELTAFNSLAIIKLPGKDIDVSDIEYAKDAMPYSLLVKPDYFNPDIF
ncbi:Oidioi.mRNA.OKI2018_I69.chr1.g3497.t1.cds [Oikopleura dioica]|uniref:Oidioi.mRNA.OKI2018_I69.chr1.g3497.t1.cds n=1 Tax=Oikopleura dioica TaxID=34765 RepID=A0ABN7SUA4_OIKDI|nr:Oidioi.mRNA.OKI2018_I69.chr1.g3497.t1.cds [Oikopleura dioica]